MNEPIRADWDDHQLTQPDGIEFNGPGTRLEFLDVDGSSDAHEHYLNRPLSQVDVRDGSVGLIDQEADQNANTVSASHPKGQKAVQSMPNTLNN